MGIFTRRRQPARESPGGDSSIWPEELPYAVGQLERLGPVDRAGRATPPQAIRGVKLARFASPSLKVEMRDDERVWVGKMPGEIGLQIGQLGFADQSLRDESLAQVL